MRTQIQNQIRSLSSMIENIREGVYQVPPFQRKFVWKREQIQDLFDSISKGYPIGSILLWRPNTKPQWGENRLVGGFYLPCKQPVSYVLDGYQRLATLFGCLTNPHTAGIPYDPAVRNDKFNLHYDLKTEKFLYCQPAKNKPWQIPVYLLSSTSEFRKYIRNILEPAVPDNEQLDKYLDRADAFAAILADYKLSVIEVEGATLEDAVNIFSRINSKGTGITDDWKVNALSFNSGFNFSEEVAQVIDNLRQYNFHNVPSETIFRCYQSAFDDRLYIDTDIETISRRGDFESVVKEMSPAIIKAVDFLYNRLNVIDHKLLPYTAQLVFLSVFFMRMPSPTTIHLDDMERWFWITTYSNYFTASSLSIQRKAFEHLLEYIEGWSDDPLYEEMPQKSVKVKPWPEKFKLSSARCTALALFQLKMIKESGVHVNPLATSLTVKKIFKHIDTWPENLMITFADPKSKTQHPYCVPIDTQLFAIEDIDNELAMRKYKLQALERGFVESLGLSYDQ